ncbi:MAG: alpha/beta hydrolase [Nitrospinae bacterium]|nr:alpha/beta hydrolase [Nitrospinota bacterium]
MYQDARGCKVYFEQAGSGSPVLLLHGWGVSSEAFRPLFMRLAAHRAVRAIDFPGFGLSEPPPGVWGTEEYAEMVKELLDAWNLPTVDILAHSFGARVALRLAAAHPKRVGRLALTGAAGIRLRGNVPFTKKCISNLGKFAGFFGPPGAWLKSKLYATIASADYLNAGTMRPILVKTVNEDLRPILPDIAHQTLLLWGANDQDTKPEAGRIMREGLKNSRLVMMEGAGHYPFLDKPDEFWEQLKVFWEI